MLKDEYDSTMGMFLLNLPQAPVCHTSVQPYTILVELLPEECYASSLLLSVAV